MASTAKITVEHVNQPDDITVDLKLPQACEFSGDPAFLLGNREEQELADETCRKPKDEPQDELHVPHAVDDSTRRFKEEAATTTASGGGLTSHL